MIVRGKTVYRGKAKCADYIRYILYYKPNISLAVIEAKDNNSAVGVWLQQALEFADTLKLPFVCFFERRRLRLPRRDLIVVDECHRGSAAEDSAWREILEYFSSATQIGMTATPKETKYVSNIDYFGNPVYTYSLRQGIDDGYLAPYKVVKVHIDRDVEGYRPEPKKRDLQGIEVEDRIYNQKDFDRSLVIDERTRLVAKKVSDLLRQSEDRFQKTIVFCVDTEHAARMRLALVNENSDLCAQFPRYVMRITGNDDEGVAQLDQFIDPESRFPVIVTTSRLLTTGIDAQTCRVIAIDREVGSMTEFKQIVGRGTRIHEDTKKYYFTLLDFRSRNSVWTEFSPTLPASLSPSPARRTAPTRMRCALDTATECWRHPRLRRPQMARRGGIPASRSRRTARRPPRTRSALHRETRHGA